MTRKYLSKTRQILNDPTYNPNAFLNWLRKEMHLKSDAALSRAIHVSQTEISKMRQLQAGVGATFILAAHETFGIPVAVLRSKMHLPFEQQPQQELFTTTQPAAPIIEAAPIDKESLMAMRAMLTKIGDAIGVKL
jgi:hypothetical protein